MNRRYKDMDNTELFKAQEQIDQEELDRLIECAVLLGSIKSDISDMDVEIRFAKDMEMAKRFTDLKNSLMRDKCKLQEIIDKRRKRILARL
jgi:hypothetical protein